MRSTAARLRTRKQELAELMTREMGKTVQSARAEVEKCAWVCEYFAENAERFLAAEPVETDASRSYVTFNPIGVVLAVMPWNFPFWQVFRFVAPALMAGNAGLLKHASNVQGCALAIEDVLRDAGAPQDLFRALLVSGHRIPALIADPRIAAVTLTGSTEAGRSVGSAAGHEIKKSVLELGGSDAYLVLEDADLDLAASTCVASRMINGGQSCIAAKRFIVVESVAAEFEQRVVAHMQAIEMGNPLEQETQLGPMARVDLRDELHDQVERSISEGADLVVGGAIPPGPGAFYPPTVLTNVGPGNPAFVEELFGPVAAIVGARDEAHAIELANDSVFGLGAAVFTRDVQRGEWIAANELEAGHCAVNSFVKSDPRLPFGGVKTSGYGRELSWYGIREFTNIKTVYIA
jgi:succinate-semialdehyde dehydrogenase/glutarate-semialdehyde dehydrogenase